MKQGDKRIESAPQGPLVLVENEATVGGQYDHWADDTGVQYQFPNQYRNRVQTGRPFVYYRGVRRAGGKRGKPEYFGCGVVGSKWRDPDIPTEAPRRDWRWFCAIEDYQPFAQPVPAKPGGQPIEAIAGSMGWRTGVRELSWERFSQILELAGQSDAEAIPRVPELGRVQLTLVEDLGAILVARETDGNGAGGSEGMRRSVESKQVGDRAEELVVQWLRESLPGAEAETVEWVASRGIKPGWDIEYRRAAGSRVAVEVKGTALSKFASIELTANEWAAAQTLRGAYRLALVAGAMSASPRIALVDDVGGSVESGAWSASPTVWRLRRKR